MTALPFQFECPAAFFEKAEAPHGQRRRIAGVISTESRDRQKEIVIQKGLSFDEFVQHGWYNDNHSKDTDGIVGYPEKVKQFSKGQQLPNGDTAKHNLTWAEGYLLEGHARSDRIWNLGMALQKAGGGRRLGFSVEGGVERREGPGRRTIAKARVRNVAITNCFPGDVRVAGAGDKVMRRHYSGPMVEIHLATGEKLTGTPHHPIFTQRGWVALGELDEVNDRIGRFDSDLRAPSATAISHEIQDVPPTFQEVFDLARLSRACSWVGLAGEGQFHGDASDSDVDVVLTDGLLRDRIEAAFFQKFGKNALPASDKQAETLAGLGTTYKLSVAGFFAPASSVRGQRPSLSLLGGELRSPSELVFVPIPGDASSLGGVENRLSGNPIFGRDSGRTLSGAIGFAKLTFKRVFNFSGHVFNLQTSHGWYEANGIVAHNCPVNSDTKLEIIAKSLIAVQQVSGSVLDEVVKALTMGTTAPGFTPGQAPVGPKTGAGAGQVLTPESLESGNKLSLKIESDDDDDEEKVKKLSKAEAILWLHARMPQVSAQTLGRIVDTTFLLKRKRML